MLVLGMPWLSQKLRCAAASAARVGLFWTLAGCAAAPTPAPVYRAQWTPEAEARAIGAAKRHPIAQPRQRPLYPEQAPPPLPTRGLPSDAPPPYYRQEPYRQEPQFPEPYDERAPEPAPYDDYDGSGPPTYQPYR
jgi:hypothetical protein